MSATTTAATTTTITTGALEINEILYLVGSFLEKQRDLGSCLLVCRRWYAVFVSCYWWTVLMNDFCSILDKKFLTHEKLKYRLRKALHKKERSTRQQRPLPQQKELQQCHQHQQDEQQHASTSIITSQSQPRLPSLTKQSGDQSRHSPLDLSAYETAWAQQKSLDELFYNHICDNVLEKAARLGNTGRTVAIKSFLGLLLLAGPRTDLKRFHFVSVRELVDETLHVPQQVIPEVIKVKLLDKTSAAAARTTDLVHSINEQDRFDAMSHPDNSINDEDKQPSHGQDNGEGGLVKLNSKSQQALDVIMAIIEQNRDLETVRLEDRMDDRHCLWSSTVKAETRHRVSSSENKVLAPFSSSASSPTHSIKLWWPHLRQLHLQTCNVESDFLYILLANTPVLDRLWLYYVDVKTTTTEVTTAGSLSTGFGTPASKSIDTLGLCRVTGIALWIQLDFARSLPCLKSLTLSVDSGADTSIGAFMRPLSDQSTPITFSDTGALSGDSYCSTVVGFPALESINIVFPTSTILTLPPAMNLMYLMSTQRPLRVRHIFDWIGTTSAAAVTTGTPAWPSPFSSGLSHIAIRDSKVQSEELSMIIRRYHTWLETVQLDTVTGIAGNITLLILQQCSRLRNLDVKNIASFDYQDSQYDLDRPWACQETLENLAISVLGVYDELTLTTNATRPGTEAKRGSLNGERLHDDDGTKDPAYSPLPRSLDRQELFLERLGSLVRLRELDLITNSYHSKRKGTNTALTTGHASLFSNGSPLTTVAWDTHVWLDQSLDLCLAKGLDRLRNLKRLEVLDIRTMFRRLDSRDYDPARPEMSMSRPMRSAGVPEAVWMAEHWPRLRVAKGVGHYDSLFRSTLQSLLPAELNASF
ncbi:hypothetical protein BGZ83_006193 [Gryganskiella cystojenkinii]|nr:hypothetical protein BGZ83_006193 [Gryganskiella cystojenkinii]